MTTLGSKPVSIVLSALLIFALTACGSKQEAQPTASSSGTETPAGSEPGVIFEPSQPASPSESVSQEQSPEPSASSSASVSPSPDKEPAATSEPSASESHGHDSPKPSQDDDGEKGDDDEPSRSPEPSESATPSAFPSESPSPSASPDPSPSPSQEPVSQTFVVEIKGFAFSPAEITVKPGDKVKFINRDKVEHTATADDGSFNSDLLGQDDSKTFTMKTEGTFGYFCAPHPDMRGEIVVKAE